MTDATDSERCLPNIEEGEIEINDVIKVEPNQSSQTHLEEAEYEAELTDIIKVDPDHSLLLEGDILGVPDHTTAEAVESLNAGSSGEQELSTIELVRVDQVRPEQGNRIKKTTSSVATQCSPTRESTFPEMVNSIQTFASSLDQSPEERMPEPTSQEDAANRNRFYRHLGLSRLRVPNKRGRPTKSAETPVFRSDIEQLTKQAQNVRETKLKAKKVRMERERRKGLSELFDNLQASVLNQGLNKSSNTPKSSNTLMSSTRSRFSYLARTLAAVDCIKELELKVICNAMTFHKNPFLLGHKANTPLSQVQSQEDEWRKQVKLNRRLRSKLALEDLRSSDPLPPPPSPSLYSCAKCPFVKLPGLHPAFLHHDVWHEDRFEETRYPEGRIMI